MTNLKTKIISCTVTVLSLFFLPPFVYWLSATEIPILISTQNNGVLRDCECGDDCHGGLAERATLIARLRNQAGSILLLDGGDFSTTMGRQRKDEFVIQSYARLDYDAIAIGDLEFRNGWNFFQRITLPAALPLVCANLHHRASGQLITQPFILKEIQGVNIAVTACISPAAFDWLDSAEYPQMEILPYIPALQKLIPDLTTKADIIVLLAQVTQPEIETIARTIDDISIIVAGHRPALPAEALLEKYGKIIVSAGVESAYLANLTLHLNAANDLKNYHFDLICVGPDVPEEPKFKKFIDSYFDEFEILNHKLAPVVQGLPFYGPEYCRQCHVVAYKTWRTSAHATALDQQMQQISCESCHLLQVDPAKTVHPDTLSRTRCRRCHTPNYSPDFNYEGYWEKTKH